LVPKTALSAPGSFALNVAPSEAGEGGEIARSPVDFRASVRGGRSDPESLRAHQRHPAETGPELEVNVLV